MAYHLQDRVYFSIFFNGQEFPFNEVNQFNYFHAVASTKAALPKFVVSLQDNEQWLTRTGSVADGTEITAIFSAGSQEHTEVRTLTFRLASHKRVSADNSTVFVLEGLLSVPTYLSSTSIKPRRGSSSEVLEELARDCSLSYAGVGTADSQVWYPNNRPFYLFAKHIAERGYASANSCMAMSVDFDRTLRYRDITAMDVPTQVFALKDLSGQNGVPVISYAPSVQSGFNNHRMGYSGIRVAQSLTSEVQHERHVGIGATFNDQGDVTQNGSVKAQINTGIVSFGPVSPGNVHENSERALYQNSRGESLFSSGLTVSCPVVTDSLLLDTVQVNAANVTVEDPSAAALEGSYRVVSRVIYITPSHYSEKLELRRRTLNLSLPDSVSTAAATSNAIRNELLEQPVTSSAEVPIFNPSFLPALLTQAGAEVTGMIAGVAGTLTAAVGNASNVLASSPNVRIPLDALLADIQQLQDDGVAAINLQWAIDPLDLGGLVPPMVQDYKDQIDAAINDQTFSIEALANRTLGIAGATKGLSTGQAALTSVTSSMAGFSSKVGDALGKLSYSLRSSMQATATAQDAAAAGSAASSSGAITSASASLISEATAKEVEATGYPAEINVKKLTAFAALDEAGEGP